MASSSWRVLTGADSKSYVSLSGLEGVLKSIRDNGMPKTTDRRGIKRVMDKEMPPDLFTTVTLHMLDGTEAQFPAIHPVRQLQHLAKTRNRFADFLNQQFLAHPNDGNQKWRLSIYSDEIVPGNPLKPIANSRKALAFYFSFAEFDGAAGCEDLWMQVLVIRSNKLDSICGGWSQVFASVVKLFFSSPLDLTRGITLDLLGSGRLFFAALGIIVGDEQAIKMMFSFKGASGMKPCCLCSNITLRGLQVASHDRTSFLLPHSEWDVRKMVFATQASIQANVQELNIKRAANVSKAHFDKVESALGLAYSPHGPLWSQAFWDCLYDDLTNCIQFDWMHVYMVSGAWNTESGYLFELLKGAGFQIKIFSQYLKTYTWPKSIRGRAITGQKILEKWTDGEIKCSASEGLSIYPVIRHMLHELVACSPLADVLVKAALESYNALASVLDLLQRCKTHRDVAPHALQDAIQRHQQLRLGVYTDERYQPKMHYASHLPYALREHQLLCCWVHERKHREIKRYAESQSNAGDSTAYEKNLLQRTFLAQFYSLDTLCLRKQTQLVNPCVSNDAVAAHVRDFLGCNQLPPPQVMASQSAITNAFTVVSSKDVILTPLGVGEVWFHVALGDTVCTCFSPWISLGNNRFRTQDAPRFINTSTIEKSCVYRSDGDAIIVVVP